MNIRKIEIVLKAAESGSVSKTAEVLFLSQPAVSENISSVEKELGIKIFRRNNHGIELTDDGEIFASYARNILYNARLMEGISDKRKKSSVTLHSPQVSVLYDCFVSFCERQADADYLRLTHVTRNYQLAEAEQELLAGTCDIAIANSTPSVYQAMAEKLDLRGIYSSLLISLPLYFFVSRDHPIVRNGFSREAMRESCCIHDVDPSDISLYATPELTELISWDRMIRVDKRDARLQLVADGVGYEIGFPLSDEDMDQYHLTALPTPCGDYSLICLCRKSRMSDPYVRDLLQDILAVYDQTIPGPV